MDWTPIRDAAQSREWSRHRLSGRSGGSRGGGRVGRRESGAPDALQEVAEDKPLDSSSRFSRLR
eukprot:scaffold6531_cov169-Ochromonas_danica.AAC.17